MTPIEILVLLALAGLGLKAYQLFWHEKKKKRKK